MNEISQERRNSSRHNRRKNQARSALSSLYKRRREQYRRTNDTCVNHYVDVYSSKIFFLAVFISLFSALDAFFTTMLISAGSHEINPFMDYVLAKDIHTFLATKLLITFVCITILVMHRNHRLFNRFSGYQCLVSVFVIYSLLISYELSMVLKLISL